MKAQLTYEETELVIMAGLLADESPMPLLKKDIERCTVTISKYGVEIEVIYKDGVEPSE